MFVRFMIFSGKYCQMSGYQQLKSKRRRYFLPHEEGGGSSGARWVSVGLMAASPPRLAGTELPRF